MGRLDFIGHRPSLHLKIACKGARLTSVLYFLSKHTRPWFVNSNGITLTLVELLFYN